MKVIIAKPNGIEKKCVTDVGEIVSMTDWDGFSMDGGYAKFKTSECEFLSLAKRNFVICSGCTGIKIDGKEYFCSDPRVIMMYLWRERQKIFKETETDPPIPTREEAIEWLKEMDIPIGPQERLRERTPKLKRNFLNRKD